MAFGADGTPADNVISYVANRQTTVGTGTAAVSSPIDMADAAALITETVCHTVEPTITAATQLIEIAVNQRARYRWVAAPGGELVVPATDLAGIGFRAKSPAYVLTVTTNVAFLGMRAQGYASITSPDGVAETDTHTCNHCGACPRPGQQEARGGRRLLPRVHEGDLRRCADKRTCTPFLKAIEQAEERYHKRRWMGF